MSEKMSGHIKATLRAMVLIQESGEQSGTIECPACKGVLHFAVASNGHQRAKCETPDCLAYMQ